MSLIPRRSRRSRRTADAPETTDGLAYLSDIFEVLEQVRDGISGPSGITAVVHEDLTAIRRDMAKTQENTAAIAAAMKQIAEALRP